MKSSEAKRKKFSKENTHLPLPIFSNSNGDIEKFDGKFNGFSVTVENDNQMLKLYLNGFFGKGNLSRSYPQFVNKTKTNIIRKRQQEYRKFWRQKLDIPSQKSESVIVLPDSDSDNEDYFKNLQPIYDLDKSNLKEHLVLGLEEAYFLLDALKCLDIYFNNKLLPPEEAWNLFQDADKYFLQNYIVYHYYRSKSWVVKTGLKFGGDYLLYKEGPAFYHASYLVIIDIIDCDNLNRKEDLCRRSMSLQNVIGLQRLCETAAKELLICTILWPKTDINMSKDITNVKIKELSLKRWLLPNEDNVD